jgi:hypothetical protein
VASVQTIVKPGNIGNRVGRGASPESAALAGSNPPILAFWHFGILAFWHFGILAFWHFGILG